MFTYGEIILLNILSLNLNFTSKEEKKNPYGTWTKIHTTFCPFVNRGRKFEQEESLNTVVTVSFTEIYEYREPTRSSTTSGTVNPSWLLLRLGNVFFRSNRHKERLKIYKQSDETILDEFPSLTWDIVSRIEDCK